MLNRPAARAVTRLSLERDVKRFNSRVGQIGHSVANGSLPLQYFFRKELCCPGAKTCGDGPRKQFTRLGVIQGV